MTIKTKKCKFCKKTISSPTRIPICDGCRNKCKQRTIQAAGIALLGLFITKTDKKN